MDSHASSAIFTDPGQDSRDLIIVRGRALTEMKIQFADVSVSCAIGQLKFNPAGLCTVPHHMQISLEMLLEQLKPCALAQEGSLT